jgi:hypothetical protein
MAAPMTKEFQEYAARQQKWAMLRKEYGFKAFVIGAVALTFVLIWMMGKAYFPDYTPL